MSVCLKELFCRDVCCAHYEIQGEGKEESIQSQVVNSQLQQPQHFIPAQHCMEGMGEEKLYFPLLKSEKRQKAPLGRSFSTHFVADCRSKKVNLLVPKL